MLGPLGIAVAREGIPWPMVDKGNGAYDFRCIDRFLEAQRRHCVLPIWDLCHYGYPDGLDPLSEAFTERFAAYASAAARYVADRAHHGPLCFTRSTSRLLGYMGASGAGARRSARPRLSPRIHAGSGPRRHRRGQSDPRRFPELGWFTSTLDLDCPAARRPTRRGRAANAMTMPISLGRVSGLSTPNMAAAARSSISSAQQLQLRPDGACASPGRNTLAAIRRAHPAASD